MHRNEFTPDYLPATMPGPYGRGVDILGLAPVDGTELCLPLDYAHPDALTLRLATAQARHLYLALRHTLGAMGELPT